MKWLIYKPLPTINSRYNVACRLISFEIFPVILCTSFLFLAHSGFNPNNERPANYLITNQAWLFVCLENATSITFDTGSLHMPYAYIKTCIIIAFIDTLFKNN